MAVGTVAASWRPLHVVQEILQAASRHRPALRKVFSGWRRGIRPFLASLAGVGFRGKSSSLLSERLIAPIASPGAPMRGAARALACFRRGLAAAAAVQPPAAQGALQRLQLQRGFSSAGGRAGGAAAGAAAGRAQWLAAVAVGLSAGLGVQLYSGQQPAECKAADKKDVVSSKDRLIDKEEVAKHRTKETGAWGGRGSSSGLYLQNEPGCCPALPAVQGLRNSVWKALSRSSEPAHALCTCCCIASACITLCGHPVGPENKADQASCLPSCCVPLHPHRLFVLFASAPNDV